MENILFLTKWFEENCDGDWEHNYKISIETLDNPGWYLKVELSDTKDEGKLLSLKVFENENDWHEASSDGNTFTAYGDISKLLKLLSIFKEFIEGT